MARSPSRCGGSTRSASPYDVTPGVPSFAAAAAALGCELTLPEVAQTVILTRTATRSSAMPEGEALERLAATGATLAIHLSVTNLARIVRALTPHYGADCPAVVAYRVSWPDERLIRGTLGDIRERVKAARITRTALILVGRGARRRCDRRTRKPALRPRPPPPVCARERLERRLSPHLPRPGPALTLPRPLYCLGSPPCPDR